MALSNMQNEIVKRSHEEGKTEIDRSKEKRKIKKNYKDLDIKTKEDTTLEALETDPEISELKHGRIENLNHFTALRYE